MISTYCLQTNEINSIILNLLMNGLTDEYCKWIGSSAKRRF